MGTFRENFSGRDLLAMKERSHLTVEAELLCVSYVRAIFESNFLFSVGLRRQISVNIFQLIGM